MANQDETLLIVDHNGKQYTAKYWIRGATVTVSSGLGPDETVDVGVYDQRADQVAEIVFRRQIDRYAGGAAATVGAAAS